MKINDFLRFFEIFSDFRIFLTFLTIFGFFWFFGFFMDFWIFFGFFGFFGRFLDFWIFWNFLKLFGFFWIYFFLVIVTNVTTKNYQGYYWTPKIAKNGPKQHNRLFFARKAKKASAEAQSPPQELEIGPRSGPYLLVSFIL